MSSTVARLSSVNPSLHPLPFGPSDRTAALVSPAPTSVSTFRRRMSRGPPVAVARDVCPLRSGAPAVDATVHWDSLYKKHFAATIEIENRSSKESVQIVIALVTFLSNRSERRGRWVPWTRSTGVTLSTSSGSGPNSVNSSLCARLFISRWYVQRHERCDRLWSAAAQHWHRWCRRRVVWRVTPGPSRDPDWHSELARRGALTDTW